MLPTQRPVEMFRRILTQEECIIALRRIEVHVSLFKVDLWITWSSVFRATTRCHECILVLVHEHSTNQHANTSIVEAPGGPQTLWMKSQCRVRRVPIAWEPSTHCQRVFGP